MKAISTVRLFSIGLVAGVVAAVTALAGTPAHANANSLSWNPHVTCVPTVTTIEQVLGQAMNAQGGATYGGGGFVPGIPDKRSFTPPCSVNGLVEFVEIHNVISSCFPHITPRDGDWTCILVDPDSTLTKYMKRIHIETDLKFQKASGWSPPPNSQRIDVQGFVYWDPNHVTSAQHSYTGWELHSLTAWRPTTTMAAALSGTSVFNDALVEREVPVVLPEKDVGKE